MVRHNPAAIEKLFQQNLRLQFDTQTVYLTVKFQVAQFKLGQIYPSKKYQRAITESMQHLITIEGVPNILNLNHFSSRPEFQHIYVNLANSKSLQLLFSTLAQSKIFDQIQGICLTNNNIRNIEPITKLPMVSLDLIDLRNNDVGYLNCLVNRRVFILFQRLKIFHFFRFDPYMIWMD